MNLVQTADTVRRAFSEFLAIPTAVITGFLLLACGTFVLDHSAIAWLEPARAALHEFLKDPAATATLLGTIAGSLITVTSITISLLLVTVQQAAGTMTAQVFDQFLRRRLNQFHFGFFVGLSLFALVTLATVDDPFNPVFGATLVFVFTVVALFLLIVLFYTAIDQMRPVEIIQTIHDHVLHAHRQQQRFLARTRAVPTGARGVTMPARSTVHGFVTRIDLDGIRTCLGRNVTGWEVLLAVGIGSHVATGDVLAQAVASSADEARRLADGVTRSVHIERQRSMVADPAYGIAQLETIAWTSISTSKSDPAPGILTIYSLRDLLARWSAEDPPRPGAGEPLPIVYVDHTFARLMTAFETLAVVASESMQHQTLIAILDALASLFERLQPAQARRVEDLVLRVLSSVGDHVLTAELDRSLRGLAQVLAAAGRQSAAAAVEDGRRQLEHSVGRLGSRATRAEAWRRRAPSVDS